MKIGYIRPNQLLYGTLVLFVEKKDGKLWMCINYFTLNKTAIKISYPLPQVDDLFDHLNGAWYFNWLDLKLGYYQICIMNANVEKMTKESRYGFY
jgi:hypothetical protein